MKLCVTPHWCAELNARSPTSVLMKKNHLLSHLSQLHGSRQPIILWWHAHPSAQGPATHYSARGFFFSSFFCFLSKLWWFLQDKMSIILSQSQLWDELHPSMMNKHHPHSVFMLSLDYCFCDKEVMNSCVCTPQIAWPEISLNHPLSSAFIFLYQASTLIHALDLSQCNFWGTKIQTVWAVMLNCFLLVYFNVCSQESHLQILLNVCKRKEGCVVFGSGSMDKIVRIWY